MSSVQSRRRCKMSAHFLKKVVHLSNVQFAFRFVFLIPGLPQNEGQTVFFKIYNLWTWAM